ncbi:MAG: DNA repair and recombination protein RadB [Spirochaetes bacterium]|nr:MAG: DNA repair and recombination protein RadB [Spirochaetota bacterium]
MRNKRLSFNNKCLDELLEGGIEHGSLTNLYGPPGSGKTNIALLASVSCANNGKKVIYIDTEGGFSPERLSQISKNFDMVSKSIIVVEPKTFEEQDKLIRDLDKMLDNTGLIVLDSLVNLYRLELEDKNFQQINKKLANQLAILSKLSREKNIPVLITNQVYSDGNGIQPVSRDITKYWSKCLIELVKLDKGRRVAILRKHRSIPEGREAHFQITHDGISPAERKFKLF